jgi:hypothetical protein
MMKKGFQQIQGSQQIIFSNEHQNPKSNLLASLNLLEKSPITTKEHP